MSCLGAWKKSRTACGARNCAPGLTAPWRALHGSGGRGLDRGDSARGTGKDRRDLLGPGTRSLKDDDPPAHVHADAEFLGQVAG